jgi:hypothetical protein
MRGNPNTYLILLFGNLGREGKPEKRTKNVKEKGVMGMLSATKTKNMQHLCYTVS